MAESPGCHCPTCILTVNYPRDEWKSPGRIPVPHNSGPNTHAHTPTPPRLVYTPRHLLLFIQFPLPELSALLPLSLPPVSLSLVIDPAPSAGCFAGRATLCLPRLATITLQVVLKWAGPLYWAGEWGTVGGSSVLHRGLAELLCTRREGHLFCGRATT